MARSFLNRADAVRWARQTEVNLERGAVETPTSTVTLMALIARYAKEVTPAKKNAVGEGYILGRWQREVFCSSPAASVSAADLATWRDKRLAEGISTGTVRNALAALSAVYRHAAFEWAMDRLENPVMHLKRPPPCRARTRRVSQAEIDAIKAETGSSELPVLIDLAVETSMRLSEIVNLTWGNVNLQARTAHLPDTKNGEARTIPLSTRALASLTGQKSHPIQRIDGRVFSSTPHAVTVAFRRAVQRGRQIHLDELRTKGMTDQQGFLTDLRFHDLRHEAVSRLFELGLNVIEVGSISGHKTLQMLRRYTHLKAVDLVKKLG